MIQDFDTELGSHPKSFELANKQIFDPDSRFIFKDSLFILKIEW